MSKSPTRYAPVIRDWERLRERLLRRLTQVRQRDRKRVQARLSRLEQLELRQLMAVAVWTNVLQPLDVSGSPNSAVSPLDALLVINELNNPTYAPRSQPLPTEVDDLLKTDFVDVTCDGQVSPLDALLVINSLNAGGGDGDNPPTGSPTWRFKNSGGTDNSVGKYVANACSPRLIEGNSYTAQLSASVVLPDNNSAIRVQFSAPVFDTLTQNAIRDAFEILILDDAGQPLTYPFSAKHDASFNWSESVQPTSGVGTQTTIRPFDSVSSAIFNLSGIAAGTTVQVVARLINNDLDTTSSITIRRLDVIPATESAPAGMPYDGEASPVSTAVDATALTDVSWSVAPIYGQTSLFKNNHVLVTELQMLNQTSSVISGRMIVAIDDLSDPTIGVIDPDGFLPGGRPYLVLNSSSADGWLGTGQRTEKRELRFGNVHEQQFTYKLTTLAEMNLAPTGFTSVPLREIEAGRTYRTVAVAADPEGQTLKYRLEAGPTGMTIDANTGLTTWQTTSSDVGNHSVIVRASDPHGLSVTQSFVLAVIETLPNRPPVFTSSPTTEAKVAGTFEVSTFKVGDQPVGIAGGRFDGQNFTIATVNASDADLTIGSNSVSVGERKPSGLLFQTGQDVNIGFPKFDHADDVHALESFTQGDFNEDGNLDFITSGIYRQYDFRSRLTLGRLLTITLGDGHGGFHAPNSIALAMPSTDTDHLYYLLAGDFNNDGHLDIVGEYLNEGSTSGANAPRLIVLPGNGDGTFASAVNTDLAGRRLERFETVDINGDGRLDIVAVSSGAQQAGTLLGNGDGTFGTYNEFANFSNTGAGNYYGPAVGDLDGVNGPDIVLPDWQLQKLTVYVNDGQGGFTRQATLDARQPYYPFSGIGLSRPQTTWIADFDGDGQADILYSSDGSSNGSYGALGFYKGGGDGKTFTYKDGAQGFQYRPFNSQMKPLDFNGDGKLDVLVGGTASTSNNTAGIALGRGDGTFDIAVYGLPYTERAVSGSGSYSASYVFAGDYNRDGLLDAAVVSSPANGLMSSSASGVSILVADSPGVLEAPVALTGSPMGSSTFITITGDVNNDGNVDLLLGAGDRFSTRLGNGDGTFGAQFPATPGYYANDPHYATLVDLDHDGLLDLLWSRMQLYQGADQGYMAALGNGDGTFRVTFNLSVPGSFYGATLIPPADFNGDGYVDFAAYFGSAFSVGTTIDVYLSNPAVPGTFTASYRYIYPGDANSFNGSAINNTLTRGDFDGDGIIDLLAVAKKTGPYQNRINFFKGKGDGTFAEPTSADIFLTNTEPSLVEPAWSDSGDLNNDGKRDFVLISAYGNQSVFLGNGDGTFQSPSQYTEGYTFGADRAVVLTDIDGDGNLDMSMASERGRRGISIRRGLGDGTFDVAEYYFMTGDFAPGAASYSDIDNDGVKDLVIADNSRPNYTAVYPGVRPGMVTITTADINRDGNLDTLALNAGDGHVKLLLGSANGNVVRQNDVLVGKGALALAAVDLNGDDKLDIVTANRAARSVTVLTGDGTGEFARRDIIVGELLSDLAQGDLTGDNRPDIVVAAAQRKSLFIIANSTSGLGTPQAIATGEEPGKVTIADATGDGRNDVLVSLPLTQRIMILPGNGDGTFGVPLYANLKASAGDVDAADFNLDGKLDLAVTLPDSDQVAILFARGAGRFAVPQTIQVGDKPVGMVIQDVNRDGRPDLLVANSGDDTASQIINRYDPTKLYRYTPVAVDPDGDSIAYELLDSPGGMLMNEVTGEIIWAPTADQVGLNSVVIEASDGQGGAATQSYSIGVELNRENKPPVIFSEPPTIAPQDSVYSYTPSATDPDGDSLRYRLLDGPEGASVDPVSGVVTWDARGYALSMNRFASSNAYVSIPHTQSLAAPSFTVEGSFRFDTVDYNQVLFRKQIYDPYVSLQTFRLWYVNGGLRATIAGRDSNSAIVESNLDVNWRPEVGKWHHLAITFDDATSELSILADGQLVGSLKTDRHLLYDGMPITIGFENSNPLFGSVSNFRIWDSALSVTAIREVLTRPVAADAPGLLLDYRFSDEASLTVRDHSIHHNDGRRTGNGGWPSPARIPGLTPEQTESFTIRLEDGKGGVSIQSFSVTVVPSITQSITGVFFQDTNSDGQQDSNETGLSDTIIFIDANSNGVRDASETFATTNSVGGYQLSGLRKGNYTLVAEPRAGFTLPASRTITVDPFNAHTVNWAAVPQALGQIRGNVSLDANNNGIGTETIELYASQFDSDSPNLEPWSDKTLATTPNGSRFLGEFTNNTVTLSLGSHAAPLPAHARLNVSFDLYVLKSWDGNSGPDRWQFQIDGQELVNTTFSNSGSRQAFPQSYSGGDNAPRTGATSSNTQGYAFFGDTVYHFEFTIPHSARTATLTFQGSNLQNVDDESWGLNNVRVSVPELPIAGWPVYIDENNNQIRDTEEVFTTTDGVGGYAFAGLASGSYHVRLDNPTGWTTVGTNAGTQFVALAANSVQSSVDFGVLPTESAAAQPKFITTPKNRIAARDLYRFVNVAVDPSARPLVYSLAASPAGMSVDATFGTIVWTPTLGQVGEQRVILRAVNDSGGVAIQDFSIHVEPPNSAPLITSTPLNTAAVDQVFLYDLLAQDAEQATLDTQLVTAPSGAVLDTEGRLTWTPSSNQSGPQPFRIKVSDGRGGEAFQAFTILVLTSKLNISPTLADQLRSHATVGLQYLAQLTATDNDGDELSFSLVTGPVGMTITRSGMIRWLPTIGQLGTQVMRARADDGRGGVVERDYQIQVGSTHTNRPPEITSTPPSFAVSGRLFHYDVLAMDVDSDLLAFELVTGPVGLSLDPVHGTMRWIPAADQFGQSKVVLRTTDPYGGVDEQEFTINVRSVGGPPAIVSVPSTQAAVGHAYLATTLANDAESDPLTFALLEKPSGMTIHATTGEIEWTPTPSQLGQNQVVIQVSDGVGGFATQAFSIRVAAGVANQPPSITNDAPMVASAGTTLTYQLHAVDPEGTDIAYQLRRGPNRITVDATSGEVTWTPLASDIGTHIIALAALDAQGAAAVLSFEIEVLAANIEPAIHSQPGLKATARGLYRYDVVASDANLDPLTYSLANAPTGMTVDAFGRIRWLTSVNDLGSHSVTLTVSDPHGGKATQAIVFNVVPDTTPPKVSVIPLSTIVRSNSPEVFAKFNLTPSYPTNRVRVSAVDDVGVTSLEVRANGKPVALDANGYATFNFEDWGFGGVTVIAKSSDEAGNIGTGSRAFAFLPFGDDPVVSEFPPPSVVITSPTSGSSTRGVVQIKGSVTSDHFTSYKLSFRLSNGISTKVVGGDFDIPDEFTNVTFTTLATGTTKITDGVLGTWDTTLLESGDYVLRLEEEDDVYGTTVYEANVTVDGDFKVGNFRLSFSDITLPVAGIPITVTRTYDTLRADRSGELGYGWRFEYRDTDLRTSLPKTGLESYGIYTAFSSGTKVFVTLPGGTREGFTFTPDIRVLPGFGSRLVIATPRFTPDRGVKNTLTVRSGTFIVNDSGELVSGGGQPYNPAAEEFGGGYTLTTRDGTRYFIDGNSGLLTSATDRNSNQILFSDNGVRGSETGLTFERDTRGRITKVIDPAGQAIRYSYDAQGDLVRVADRLGNATTLAYRSSPKHFLESVTDPLGRTGVRTEYQPDGRLKTVTSGTATTNHLSYNLNDQLVTTTDALGQISTIGYDQHGNVISMTDALGRTSTMTYDESNRLVSQTNPLGYTTSYTYDAAGNQTSITDALGHRSTYVYDAAGNLVTAVDALGRSTHTTYDAHGNAIKFTDANGGEFAMTLDAKGQVVETLDALMRRTTYEYSPQGYLTATVTPDGRETELQNGPLGKPIKEVQQAMTPNGLVTLNWSYRYNANGDFIGATDASGAETSIAYDAAGNPTASVNPLGARTEVKWNDDGLQSGTTFPSGGSVTLTFDANGREKTATLPGGGIVQYEYDAAGQRTATILPDGTRVARQYDLAGQSTGGSNGTTTGGRNEYDAAGRLIRSIDSEGNVRKYERDAAGRVVAEIDSLGQRATYEYDANDNMTQAVLPTGQVLSATYDAVGNRTSRTDLNGRTWRYTYGPTNLLQTATDPTGATYTFASDGFGHNTSVTDPQGRTTTFTYDAQGRIVGTATPLGLETAMQFDSLNRLTKSTDALGRTVALTYTPGNQLASRTDADGSTTYNYDSAARLTSVRSPDGLSTLAYDSMGRLTSWTGYSGVRVDYTPDTVGRATSVATSTGTTQRTLSDTGLILKVTDATGVSSTVYDALGRATVVTYSNGNTETRSYDPVGRVMSITHRDALGAMIGQFVYSRDSVGRVSSIQEASGRRTEYIYDGGGSLVRERVVDGPSTNVIDYSYDNVGNLASRTDATGTRALTVDRDDRLISDGVWSYTWDAAGNMISRSNAEQTDVYQYDAQNRLVKVTRQGSVNTTIRYAYDYDGLLAERQEGAEIVRYVWDRSGTYPQILEERTGDDALIRRYESNGAMVTRYRDASGQAFYFQLDQLGSVRSVTNGAGQIVNSYQYDAFGNPLGTSPTGVGFTNGWTDAATGLVFLRSRWYMPSAARFTTKDSAAVNPNQPTDTWNRFAYVGNDPVNRVDPSGQLLTEVQARLVLTNLLLSMPLILAAQFSGGPVRALQGFWQAATHWWPTGNTTGISVGATIPTNFLNFSYGGGIEFLNMYTTGEQALYASLGGSVGLGSAGLGGSVLTSQIFDTPTADDYKGWFWSITGTTNLLTAAIAGVQAFGKTVAFKPVFTAGSGSATFAWSPSPTYFAAAVPGKTLQPTLSDSARNATQTDTFTMARHSHTLGGGFGTTGKSIALSITYSFQIAVWNGLGEFDWERFAKG